MGVKIFTPTLMNWNMLSSIGHITIKSDEIISHRFSKGLKTCCIFFFTLYRNLHDGYVELGWPRVKSDLEKKVMIRAKGNGHV